MRKLPPKARLLYRKTIEYAHDITTMDGDQVLGTKKEIATVEVFLDDSQLDLMMHRACINDGQTCKSGPIIVRVMR